MITAYALNKKAFVMNVAYLGAKILIYLAKKAKIALLLAKKVSVLIEYANFSMIFLKNL